MRKETRKHLAKKIREYMEENGITFTDDCPFPVSWRTIWAVRDLKTKRNFTTKTQKSLCKFFDLKYKIDGHDLILCEQL